MKPRSSKESPVLWHLPPSSVVLETQHHTGTIIMYLWFECIRDNFSAKKSMVKVHPHLLRNWKLFFSRDMMSLQDRAARRSQSKWPMCCCAWYYLGITTSLMLIWATAQTVRLIHFQPRTSSLSLWDTIPMSALTNTTRLESSRSATMKARL